MDTSTMSSSAPPKSHNLFQVFLRLRPPQAGASQSAERFLAVEPPAKEHTAPTHITLNPPNDSRRAIEKFAFTQVFEEDSTQLDVFHCTGVIPLVEGVLAPHGGDGTDALLATLGVTGSGKSHTILGSKTQRGMTQLALDVIFRSLGHNLLDCASHPYLEASISGSDPSEAAVCSASAFLETVYADPQDRPRPSSRAPTPMIGESTMGPPQTPSRRLLTRPSALPHQPDVSALSVPCDPAAEYAVVISMYEVYNDRIFDLLSPPVKSAATKEYRRRPLLFKPTEASPDRKVVAGLRKVVCGSLQQALMVLEAGLHERRVAGTGSNSVSSRSHGFFCVEVRKRARSGRHRHGGEGGGVWGGSTLTVVDLAGSERARDAKTAGATLAEAGKINESLMYLGQCLQMQSDAANNAKPGVVPFRQCKLTELLFSNSFPSTSTSSTSYSSSSTTRANNNSPRNPQKAVMIVTADPHGDFNATSQILRYSALAREITVPRIPSITQTILAPVAPQSMPGSSPLSSPTMQHSRPFFSPSSPNMSRTFSPSSVASDDHRGTMEMAALEIARLAEENEYLRQAMGAEQVARQEAQAHLLSMEDRMVDLEQAIREDCVNEFERRMEVEVARWRAAAAAEAERVEEHVNAKIEILARVFGTEGEGGSDGEEGEDKENVLVEDVWGENERLRREVEVLRRELVGMSPTRRMPLRERGGEGGEQQQQQRGSGGGAGGLQRKMERLRVSDEAAAAARSSSGSVRGTGSPTKKVRKLGAKRWDSMEDEEMF
ncbi:P-loop containing nucleoside triphosphate hydrolase protein [Coniochaeta ligniaria NRRL 30616]|uniref:Kinesin-like protein n=1 Tax=Coniochaeta ligniaria NRRL 30616 TaxID=1408157 RepID=A0A1J7JTC6_9PEZI|nr:P-loop containing nucleoside triphosphate hydrolase protein [Coniochaeta ligniaria NRRL 30616]